MYSIIWNKKERNKTQNKKDEILFAETSSCNFLFVCASVMYKFVIFFMALNESSSSSNNNNKYRV